MMDPFISCDQEMAAYDQLPRVVRERVATAPHPLPCYLLLDVYREHGLSAALRVVDHWLIVLRGKLGTTNAEQKQEREEASA